MKISTVIFKYVEGQYFSRKINYEKEPVIFKATGTLESPNLIVEYDNDDLSFVVSTGDLINAENVKFCKMFI